MLDTAAVAAIGAYQRYVSPYKGFCCAYRVRTRRRSCSAYAKAIVQRLGIEALFRALPRQFGRCKLAYAALLASRAASDQARKEEVKRDEANRCDVDPCDCLDVAGCAADLPCDVPCDLPCDCSF